MDWSHMRCDFEDKIVICRVCSNRFEIKVGESEQACFEQSRIDRLTEDIATRFVPAQSLVEEVSIGKVIKNVESGEKWTCWFHPPKQTSPQHVQCSRSPTNMVASTHDLTNHPNQPLSNVGNVLENNSFCAKCQHSASIWSSPLFAKLLLHSVNSKSMLNQC